MEEVGELVVELQRVERAFWEMRRRAREMARDLDADTGSIGVWDSQIEGSEGAKHFQLRIWCS